MQNLWEDNNSTEAEIRAANPGSRHKLKHRFPTEATALAAMRSWLLHDYLVPYCRLLAATRIFRRCYWIDSLGDMSDTRKTLPAFQEVAAAAQGLAAESRPMALQWVVLQPGRRSRAAPTQFALPKQSGIVNADWPASAPMLLDAIQQAAGFFLLNPLAVPTVSAQLKQEQGAVPFFAYEDLAPLYTRTAPTELCLLLSNAQIENRLLPALSTPTGATAFTALLRSDRWKALLAKEQPSPGRDESRPNDSLIDLLLTAIRAHFLAAQRIAFPVCAGPSLIEDAPFTLLFATRRQDSLYCMNDALCAYRRRLEEQSYQGLLNEAWFRERHQARLAGEIQDLTERILRLGRAQAPRRWPDLRQHLLLNSFGGYLLPEYDNVISGLLEAGDVRCEWRQRGQRTTGTEEHERPVPVNEDVLLWQEKKSYRAR